MKNITEKKKFLYLIAFSVVFILLIYKLTISITIAVIKDYEDLKLKTKDVSFAPQNIKLYESRMAKLEGFLRAEDIDNESLQELMLERTSNFCKNNKLKIKEFTNTFIFRKDNYEIATNVIKVIGSYHNIVKLIYHYEQEIKVGKVVAVDFERMKDRRSKTTYLFASIYLQNFNAYED